MTHANIAAERELRHAIKEGEQKEFLHWFQKARELRLIEGQGSVAGFILQMISPLQGAFVPNRWIAENVMLAKEVLYFMRHKQGQGSVAGFKVDMMKAYDRIERGFLLKVLEHFSFSNR